MFCQWNLQAVLKISQLRIWRAEMFFYTRQSWAERIPFSVNTSKSLTIYYYITYNNFELYTVINILLLTLVDVQKSLSQLTCEERFWQVTEKLLYHICHIIRWLVFIVDVFWGALIHLTKGLDSRLHPRFSKQTHLRRCHMEWGKKTPKLLKIFFLIPFYGRFWLQQKLRFAYFTLGQNKRKTCRCHSCDLPMVLYTTARSGGGTARVNHTADLYQIVDGAFRVHVVMLLLEEYKQDA